MGKKVGPWEILNSLREGGQAYTYLVEHETDKRKGVLKRLKKKARSGRFLNEIQSVKCLVDKGLLGIPTILDIATDECDGNPWYVMGYFPRGALDSQRAMICRDPLSAIRFFDDLLRIVVGVHAQKIIHRDIKPGNILIAEEEGAFKPVLSDFGIAYAYANDDERLTETAEAVGPRLYMAPELEGGKLHDVTTAADVYSLGKVLWWLMGVGDPPPREKHRENPWDLVQVTGDPRMALINELLDKVLLEDIAARLPASAFRHEIQEVLRLFPAAMEPVSEKMRCRFCGRGSYRTVESSNHAAFGLSTVSKAQWEVWVCDRCGHADLFRRDSRWQQDWIEEVVSAKAVADQSHLVVRTTDDMFSIDLRDPPAKSEIRIPVQFRNRDLKGTSITAIEGNLKIKQPDGKLVEVPGFSVVRAMDPAEGRTSLPLSLAGRDAKNFKLLAYVASEALMFLRSIASRTPIEVLVHLAITDFDDAQCAVDFSYIWTRG